VFTKAISEQSSSLAAVFRHFIHCPNLEHALGGAKGIFRAYTGENHD
jgi:hypothetical protein